MIDIQSLGNINFASFLSGTVGVIRQVVSTVVIAAAALFIFLYLTHNYKIRVWEKRGNNIMLMKSYKAKKVKRGAVAKLVIFPAIPILNRPSFPYPKSPDMIYLEGKQEVINLFKKGEDMYLPIKFKQSEKEEASTFTPVSQEMLLWNQFKQEKVIELTKRPNPLMQYLPQFIFIFVVVICLIIILITLEKMDAVSAACSARSAAQTLT